MQSHRRPRGKIFFESFCAVSVGVSFVGAWTQTGAWAFLAPAFVFTLFGLYWALDMFGIDSPAVAAAARLEPEADDALPAEPADIRFERFEPPAEPALEPVSGATLGPQAEAALIAEPKRKRGTKKPPKVEELPA